MNCRFLFLLFAPASLAAQKKSPAAPARYTSVSVYTTASNTPLRLSKSAPLTFHDLKQPGETELSIFIDPEHSFQAMVGIGGALTDAAAETFAKLPVNARQDLLTAYYDKEKGIGYTLARTNINSCDFSSDTYTYVSDNDTALKTFSVEHDKQYKIPLIKAAMKAAGGKLDLYVSPWSPPAWMKSNNDMLHGGKLLPAFMPSWANYYVKFIKTYEAMGMPIWGLTLQNEPMATQKWESCNYTAEDERDYIKNYLGPTLQKAGLGNKKLMAWDHNRDLIFQQASVILNDPAAAKYIWGIGFHWYETWTGAAMAFGNVGMVNRAFPGKALVFTEGCKEQFNIDSINNWSLGERYGNAMINDFNNGTSGWTDWNIVLDENGGPNHVGNFCFAPVHADTKTGKLMFTNAYYYIGQFSKFIRPGAKRIAASSSRSFLQTTAFRNTDGSIAVVVMNSTDQKIPYHLWMNGRAADTESLPHSIATLVMR